MAPEDPRPPHKEETGPRFPEVPPIPEVPEAPRLAKVTPPRKPAAMSNASEPGSYRDQALAYTAASQFVTPILALGLAGWWLQGRFHFAPWGVLIGFTVGFVVGVASLLKVVNRMGK